MKTIHIATTNTGKVEEMQNIAFSLPLSIKSIVINKVAEENGDTFAKNSEIKFLAYEKENPSIEHLIAEDSGFEISSLEGFPSVHSARFLSKFQTKKQAFIELQNMTSKNLNNTKARFVCDICTRIQGVIRHFYSTVDGNITFNYINDDGFGYDPIFLPQFSVKTFAQMSCEEKNKISHRAKAFLNFTSVIL